MAKLELFSAVRLNYTGGCVIAAIRYVEYLFWEGFLLIDGIAFDFL